MIVKNIIDNDYSNYKTCSMFIGFPTCTFKCEKECGCKGMCQNTALANSPNIEISCHDIIRRYLDNPLSSAIVCGGLEPMDSKEDLLELIHELRLFYDDPVIIYTGYYKEEISEIIEQLKQYTNIIVKFGRFIPNQEKHYDEVLGVFLASDNQYAELIS